jgi:hypothetical protein
MLSSTPSFRRHYPVTLNLSVQVWYVEKFSRFVGKKKGKVIPVQAMMAYRGVGGIDPLILSLGASWSFNFRPQPFYPRERTPVPIE